MSKTTMYAAVTEIPAALAVVPAQLFAPSMWPNTAKLGSHRVSEAAGSAKTDAMFGQARRPRRIPL